MNYKGLKIYYFISGICAVLSLVFLRLDLPEIAFPSVYVSVYMFGCGVSDDIERVKK